jgi:phosphate/sulfate permease
MGIITALLIAGGILHSKPFAIPVPAILAAASAIALGTFFGGWRIVKTMAFRLTDLRPYQGFCAETGGEAVLTSMDLPMQFQVLSWVWAQPKDYLQLDGKRGSALSMHG